MGVDAPDRCGAMTVPVPSAYAGMLCTLRVLASCWRVLGWCCSFFFMDIRVLIERMDRPTADSVDREKLQDPLSVGEGDSVCWSAPCRVTDRHIDGRCVWSVGSVGRSDRDW